MFNLHSFRCWFAACLVLLTHAALASVPIFTVTTTADSGAGSLRDAITQGNTQGGAIITFDAATFPPNTSTTIQLQSALPDLNVSFTITGPGAKVATIRGFDSGSSLNPGRIFRVPVTGSANISGLTLAGGRVVGARGTFGVAPTAGGDGVGGAIFNSGAVVVSDCFFSDCRVDAGSGGSAFGGGVPNGAPGGNALGGAICSNGSALTVSRCTFLECFAQGGFGGGGENGVAGSNGTGGAAGAALGGAIAVFSGSCLIENCTFSTNVAFGGFGGNGGLVNGTGSTRAAGGIGGAAEGGAIYAATAATVTSCTIVGGAPSGGNKNCTAGIGGLKNGNAREPAGTTLGGGVRAVGTVTLVNTIVAGNTAGVHQQGTAVSDVSGTFSSSGYNFIGAVDGSTGLTADTNQRGTAAAPINPKLGPLADTGGPTLTIRPLRGSPVVDKGNSFGLATDQRGLTRPVDLDDSIYANAGGGDGADIGAWEGQTLPNDVPVANGGLVQGTVGVVFSGQAIGGYDLDGDALTFRLVTGETLPAGLTLNSDGSVTGTVNTIGVTTVHYIANDGLADSAPGQLDVFVYEAPSFVVTTTIDNSTNLDGLISLREAVTYANTSGVAQAITFDATVFATAKTITLANVNGGPLNVGSDLDITAPAAGVTLSGGDETGIFQISTAGAVNLRNLTITHAANNSAVAAFAGTITLSGCTLRDNAATDFVKGGAIANYATLTLVNCTLAGNTANGANGGGGGAIYQQAGTLSVLNCTITQNDAGTNAGGALLIEGGTAEIGNSIITGNTATSGSDLNDASAAGTITSLGFNIIGSTTGATFTPAATDKIGVNPFLDSDGLFGNGGPTQTIALLPGSAAIDAGKTFGNATSDQRGLTRPFDRTGTANASGGDGSDIGAFETQALAPEIGVRDPMNAPVTSGVSSVGFASQNVGTAGPQTFMVQNKGDTDLTLTGSPIVAISGASAADFTVQRQPPTPVSGNTGVGFIIAFTPHSIGMKTATISIASNDANENPFTFTVTGTGVDTITVAPTIVKPLTGGKVSPQARITYTLPEAGLAGSVTLTFDNGTQYPFTLPSGSETVGTHTVTLDTVAAGMPLGIYDLTLSYQDAAGFPAATATSNDVRLRSANPVTTSQLASGAAAPGAGTNGLPADAVIASFGTPATDDDGDIAFLAKWTSVTGPVKKGSGLFLNSTCLAIVGGDASAVGGAGATWKSFTDPVLDNAGRVVSIATLAGVAKTAASIVVATDTGGPLAKIVQSGDAATGDGAQFKSFKAVAYVGGNLAILTQLAAGTGTTPKTSAANDLGVWFQHPGGGFLPIREGATVGGKTIKTLVSFMPGNGSPGCGRGWFIQPTDGDPQIGALAMFTDKTQGLIFQDVDESDFTLISLSGHAATGLDSGATFASYGPPARNAAETTTFLGKLTPGAGVTKADASGIFTGPDTSGKFEAVIRTGGDAAQAGAGATFGLLKDPVLSSDGAIAFLATVKGVKVPASQTLWWQPAGGNLTLLAQGGDEAGDLPGSQWKAFPSLAIAGGDRGPIFAATLVPGKGGVLKTSAAGVWATDFDNNPRLLFRTGDTIDIGGGVMKTVKSFTLLKVSVGNTGVTRSFNDDAQVVWLATFTDKTTAIMTTEVP